MFAAARRSATSKSFTRAFSSTPRAQSDVAKLILIGRLGKNPEVRMTRSDKEYISYTVATTNYPPPPPNPDGTRPEPSTSWHTILSFSPTANNYLRTLQKGSQVYVEANYELREADPAADADSPAAQRQILLRHETIRVLKRASAPSESS
ncbi:single-stranded DNA-binding protein [Phanerochaete sordida]|uniref:Single-stranded DNA-binding protein n=1 Tax=Phanerochaete sordida TaxID=48140 RepID=A0A9P3FXG8_9APHY|nr:single-stranded DNA-binding protein [Phanerochaete sordida]